MVVSMTREKCISVSLIFLLYVLKSLEIIDKSLLIKKAEALSELKILGAAN